MRTLPKDFTFCTGLLCDKKLSCLRYLNLMNPKNKELENRLSVSDFGDKDGKCTEHYIENTLTEEIENAMDEN
jgi:hypothetical protein